ncbi:MAG: DUF922 domain-containing protein [Ferruginibacter sp.]
MYKKFFLITVASFFAIASQAQKLTVVVKYATSDGTSNNNMIYYQPGSLLDWTDFKGKPVTGSDAAALTSAGFGVKLSFKRVNDISQLIISVICSFSRKDSWVLPGNKTAYILNHEQKHFDIAYIHTLEFVQNLRNAHFTNANYQSVIEKVYNETAKEMSKVQDQYDSETSHSRIPAKQGEWDEKISGQLALAAKNNE